MDGTATVQWRSIARWAAIVAGAAFLIGGVLQAVMAYEVGTPSTPLDGVLCSDCTGAERLGFGRAWFDYTTATHGMQQTMFIAYGVAFMAFGVVAMALRYVLGPDRPIVVVGSRALFAAAALGLLGQIVAYARLDLVYQWGRFVSDETLVAATLATDAVSFLTYWLGAVFFVVVGAGLLATAAGAAAAGAAWRRWSVMTYSAAALTLAAGVTSFLPLGQVTEVLTLLAAIVAGPVWSLWLARQLQTDSVDVAITTPTPAPTAG